MEGMTCIIVHAFAWNSMRILHTSDWHLGQNFYSKKPRLMTSGFFWTGFAGDRAGPSGGCHYCHGDIFDTGFASKLCPELYNRFVVGEFGKRTINLWWCWPIVVIPSYAKRISRDILAFLQYNRDRQRGYAPGYFIVATGLPGAVLCPIPFAPARHYYQSGGIYPAAKQQQLLHALPLLSTAVSGSVPATRRTKAPVIATGHLCLRRRQQKRCGSRHLYRYAGCAFRRSISPRIISHWDTFTARNVSAARYISLLRLTTSPSAFDECGRNACVWWATSSRGMAKYRKSVAVPVTQPLAVLKGDFGVRIAEQRAVARRW